MFPAMATASPNTGNKRRERSTSSTRRKSSGRKTYERLKWLLLYRKNQPLREKAALETTAGTTRSPRMRPNRYAAAAPSTKAPTIERSHISGVGCRLTASSSGVEDRALHVRGVRRAGCLVRVPEWDLALRVRTMGHLCPRLERPGGRAKVESEVGRVRSRLARKRCVAVRPRRPCRRAERTPAEEDRREGNDDDEA